MTNDQIESAATDHASKYPEHLKTDIVLHYGLGIVRGLKEGMEELAAKDKEIAEQKEKVAGLLKVLNGFVDGYDHDQDAHKYDNLPACIKCYSQKMIEKYS